MEYKYRIPCCKDRLVELRNFVAGVLGKLAISEIEANSMVLAVDEVCANLMIHSHNCNPSEYIEVKIKTKNGEITFEIEDHGTGFNISKYQEPDLSDIVQKQKKGGIGLMLVRRIIDEIEFIEGKESNLYRLYKKVNLS